MAQATGISVSSVQRIWRCHGLQPHRMRRFKLSTDPDFAHKVRDIVGLYVDPPSHAVVLSVDEKSHIQALDRTQPGLPLKRGRCGTMTHDYKRNGTTKLDTGPVIETRSLGALTGGKPLPIGRGHSVGISAALRVRNEPAISRSLERTARTCGCSRCSSSTRRLLSEP
jgi:hypothetical protein